MAGFSLVLAVLVVALIWYARDSWTARSTNEAAPIVLQLPTRPQSRDAEQIAHAAPAVSSRSSDTNAIGNPEAPGAMPPSTRIEERSDVRWAGKASVLNALERFHDAKLAFENDPTNTERLESALTLAKTNGWWTEVRGLLARRVIEVPNDATTHLQLGAVLLRLSSAPEAILTLKRALELDPNIAEAWYNLAIAEQTCGHLTAAREAWDETLRRMPQNPDAWTHRGEIELDQQEWSAAEADFRTALRLEPDQLDVSMNLALALHRLDRLAEARELLERRLASEPENVRLLNRLAEIAADQALDDGSQRSAHLEAAREYCRRSLAASANQPELAELRERIEQTARDLH